MHPSWRRPKSSPRGDCSTWNNAGCLLILLALLGCHRGLFNAKGQVGTDGPAFGTWASPPQGCSRDPMDGLPDSQTSTLATFFWEDPADHNIMLRDHHMDVVPDAAQQLNLIRVPGGYSVRIKTVQTAGTLLTAKDCSTFKIDTHEQPAGFAGGRPALGGEVHLECSYQQSRVFANFTFDRCDF